MRGLKRQRCARVIVPVTHSCENLRRGHYELGTDVSANQRVGAAFADLARVI
jgi:transposase, IS6 family